MLKQLLFNCIVFAGSIVPFCITDYFFVRSGQNHESIWFSNWLGFVLYSIPAIGFFVVNWQRAQLFTGRLRWIYSIGMTAIIGFLWLRLLPWIILPFHIQIGGKL